MNANSEFFRREPQADKADWKSIVARYQQPSAPRAIWQIINTIGPYILLWYLMYLSLAISWWLTIPLAILAGAFLVRVFIIFHDCGHGSFFKSRTANDVWGFLCGILTFTPYYHWRWEHSLHHATRRLWAWRDEFGNESHWAVILGRMVAARGADNLWPFVTGD